jgi:hypothetical protein
VRGGVERRRVPVGHGERRRDGPLRQRRGLAQHRADGLAVEFGALVGLEDLVQAEQVEQDELQVTRIAAVVVHSPGPSSMVRRADGRATGPP